MSTNRAIAFKPPRKPAGAFFHWDAPDLPIAVHFHLNVIDVLEGNAVRAGKKETAGILLGRIENGQRPTIIIEDSEPIAVTADPAGNDSPFGNRAAWETVVARWDSRTEKRISIVGFYRSSSEQNTLTSQDVELLKANWIDSEKIFLVIEPHVEKPASGVLFMAPEGVDPWKWSEVPFNRSELAKANGAPEGAKGKTDDRAAQSQLATIDKVPEAQRENEDKPEGLTPLQWALGGIVLFAILIAALISLGAGQIFHAAANGKELSDDSPLGLRTQRNGTDLRVSWDRKSSVLADATQGQLSIIDGSAYKTVDLGVSELKSGSISYTPITDDVALRLDVINDKFATVATESVRVIGGLSTVVPNQAVDASAGSRARMPQSSPPVPQHKSNPIAASDRSRDSHIDSPDKKQADQQVQKQEDRPVEQKAIEAAPPVAEAKLLASPAAPVIRGVPEPAEREEVSSTSSQVPVQIEPNAASILFPSASALLGKENPASTETPRSVANPAAGYSSALEPARLIIGREPQYPSVAKQLRVSGSVKITFLVGSDGKVKRINSVSGPDALKQAVIEVVKGQRYNPARLNGAPTESEVSMVYAFKLN